jgi:hypothetical protein
MRSTRPSRQQPPSRNAPGSSPAVHRGACSARASRARSARRASAAPRATRGRTRAHSSVPQVEARCPGARRHPAPPRMRSTARCWPRPTLVCAPQPRLARPSRPGARGALEGRAEHGRHRDSHCKYAERLHHPPIRSRQRKPEKPTGVAPQGLLVMRLWRGWESTWAFSVSMFALRQTAVGRPGECDEGPAAGPKWQSHTAAVSCFNVHGPDDRLGWPPPFTVHGRTSQTSLGRPSSRQIECQQMAVQ